MFLAAKRAFALKIVLGADTRRPRHPVSAAQVVRAVGRRVRVCSAGHGRKADAGCFERLETRLLPVDRQQTAPKLVLRFSESVDATSLNTGAFV